MLKQCGKHKRMLPVGLGGNMDKKTLDFFSTNSKIKDIALKAREKLLTVHYFPGANIYFMYDTDNTIKKEFVWIIIRTKKSTEEAYNILEDFDREWWVEQLPSCEGKLSISVRAKESFY